MLTELTEVPLFYQILEFHVQILINIESYKPLTFRIETHKDKTNFFTQMISSYSSISFMNGSKYIAARDYLSVKVWDICKTDKPLLSIPVQ